MPFYYIHGDSEQKWENYTLIMPVVAVGNVGQLAIDLLLNNLNVKHEGYLHDSCILPIAGGNPFDSSSKKLATGWEFFVCDEKKLLIVQQRAPIAAGRTKEYKKLLFDWIKKHKFRLTIALSSTFSQFYTIEELQGVPMHYLYSSSNISAIEESKLKELSWKQFYIAPETNPANTFAIPGGGITASFLNECQEKQIPCVALILICSEGNNYPEAYRMVENLNNWLSLKKDQDETQQWKMPISWKLPYGCDPPPSIY